jgi:predicted nucleic acid-binding Zn ribbon protein
MLSANDEVDENDFENDIEKGDIIDDGTRRRTRRTRMRMMLMLMMMMMMTRWSG